MKSIGCFRFSVLIQTELSGIFVCFMRDIQLNPVENM